MYAPWRSDQYTARLVSYKIRLICRGNIIRVLHVQAFEHTQIQIYINIQADILGCDAV
jgi:hypothetical protein